MKIEKGVPVTENAGSLWLAARGIYSKMEVGDSIFFEERKEAARFYYAADHHRRVNKWQVKYALRRVEGGYRVWRIA